MATVCYVLLATFAFAMWPTASGQLIVDNKPYRLDILPTYLILAPKRIYPNQVMQISVSILRLYYSHLVVRGSVRQGTDEFATFTETFLNPSTRVVQMKIPQYAPPGNYTLRIVGSTTDVMSGNLFENETSLIFSSKQASVFITTNKPLYYQAQNVSFRIIPVKPNLLMAFGSLDIYVMDPHNVIVRRWMGMQPNQGMLDMVLPLSEQPPYGQWKIQVRFYGANYEKTFLVEEYFRPRFFVNVTMPQYIMDDYMGLAGTIFANHTSGRPARGNGNIMLKVMPPPNYQGLDRSYCANQTIYREIPLFEGKSDFLFKMTELEALIGQKPTGCELHVNVTIVDWFLLINRTGYAITVVYAQDVLLKLLGDFSRTFIPGYPVTVFYAVQQADGSPLAAMRRQITITHIERDLTGLSTTYPDQKFLVPDDGIVQYSFIAGQNSQYINLMAYYDTEGSGQSRVECRLWRTYTYYGHYLQITTSTQHPQVGEYMVFTVRSSIQVPMIYYVITASGNIVVGDQMEMSGTQKTFSVALSRDMVPSAHIIVYYVDMDEIVASSLNFFVNGSGLNPVNVVVNMGKDLTRDTVELSIRTSPTSFTGVQVLDYDLYWQGGNTFLLEKDVIEELEQYDSDANKSYSALFYYGEELYTKVYFPAPSYGVDANTTLTYSGLIVFTDGNVTRIPNYCNYTMGYFPCNDQMCYHVSQRCDGIVQCEDGVDEMGCKQPTTDVYTPRMYRFRHLNRHYEEDGLWGWKSTFVRPDGRVDFKVPVPKEPMSWLVGAVSMSREVGFWFTTFPTRHQATRFFYIQVEMPEIVTRGEQIGVRIELFNYWMVDLECLVTLLDSDDYRFVLVEDYGRVSSYAPRTSRGDIQTMAYVPAGEMLSIYMPVLPIKWGTTINVTISATSFMGEDRVVKPLQIIYDGVTNWFNAPYLIDLINSGQLQIPPFDIPVDQRFIYPEQRMHLYVPGSQKAVLNVIGDAMGPMLWEPRMTSDNFMKKPYYSCETSMFNFAMIVYQLKYLKTTNQVDQATLNHYLGQMNIELQRVMGFYNLTGHYFSMYRDYRGPIPSVWLTTFIMRSIHYADDQDWQLNFYVDYDFLNSIATWITKQQDPVTGAFRDLSPIYDRKFQENVTYVNGVPTTFNVSLTAYVLIGMAEATRITGAARIALDAAKAKAADYIAQFVANITDPFQMSIVAYALMSVSHARSDDAIARLNSMRRSTEYTYWANYDIPKNPIRTVNNIQYMMARIIYPNEGYAVQASSYGLLIYIQQNNYKDSVAIVKFLHSVRNTIGGFGGTQDTITALQALSEFGKRDTNRAIYNIRLTVRSTATDNFKQIIDMKKGNWTITKFVNIPEVWGQVPTEVQGTGMATMQLFTTVNVEYPELQAPLSNGTFFRVEPPTIEFSGRNMSIMRMTTCARWLRPDISYRTGMVVIEVGIPNGYVVMNDDLRAYVRSGEVPTLGGAEWYDRKVIFYFDYFTANELSCARFEAYRWFPIANSTIQHEIRVYDFYEPGMFNRTIYTVYNLFNLHACQVCASFQCPYCPFYNVASPLYLHYGLVYTLLVAALLITWYKST